MKKTFRNSSLIAMAAVLGAPHASAQTAFQGTYTVEPGANPTITRGTTDTIVLNDAETVINWQPTDTSGPGEIDFLPNGRTALFTNSVSGVSDFTVLNRILPVDGNGLPVSSVIALNGTVQSRINGNLGGKVWFYAPGGIVVGKDSVFSVGSLVLTSNDIDATGGLFDPITGAIRFRGPSNVLSSVEVKSGAQINALSAGSYVALVAPRVVQGGTVTVNGTAAYVGAEQADIRINGGLFDISIGAGTTDQNGVVHTGATERVDSVTSTDAQHVYMVAVPKNNALTMLLSGNVGYNAADSVVQDGSAVILAAGQDVFGDFIGMPNATATGPSNISIGAGNWQPNVTGAATGAVTLRANAGEAIAAGGDVNLSAGSGYSGGKIDLLTFGGSGSAATNGRIAVAGTLTLDVSSQAFSGQSLPPPVGENATGGEINLIAAGGTISAASLNAYANAVSGAGSSRSGDATGGRITLSAGTAAGPGGTEAGSLSLGSVSLNATAQTGFDYYFSSATDGGNALGGTVAIAAAGGSFSASDLFVNVDAAGGDATTVAGIGTGGNVTLSVSAAGGLRGSFALTDCTLRQCEVLAGGRGGEGMDGGTGTGGSILVHASDADFAVTGDLALRADGLGGASSSSDGVAGRGGDGVGGSVTVESRAGAGVMRFDGLYLSADGVAGNIIDGISFNDGNGGNGTGGTLGLLVAGGSLTAALLDASASGRGGAANVNCLTCDGGGTTAFIGGTGQGGTANFLITGGSADIAALALAANGTGGEADAADDPGEVSAISGQGIGGAALLESRGGVLHAGTISIDAGGAGGDGYYNVFQADGVDGGAGTGGTARLLMDVGGAGQVIADTGIIVRALGKGGFGAPTASDTATDYLAGNGGSGTGGTAGLTLASGALTTPSLLLSAEGIGGTGGDNATGGPGGAAGSGTGGTARVAYLSEGHAIGALTVKADGEGGLAGVNGYLDFDSNGNPFTVYGSGAGGAGGAGTGGMADMLIDVDPSFVSLSVSADGIGSAGGIGGTSGPGGTGTGGIATLDIGFGATSVSGSLRVSASGLGGVGGTGLDGSGGRGGDAFGGSATLGLAGSSTMLDAGDIGVIAHALGGAGGAGGVRQVPGVNGAAGGDATGGTALFAVTAGASAIGGAALQVSGDATGGAGSAGTAGALGGTGGSGGAARAGSATLRIDGGRLRYDSALSAPPAYDVTAVGLGGAGAAGGDGSTGGPGGDGGNGSGGTAGFDANNADFALGSLTIVAGGVGGLGGAGGKAGGVPGADGQSSGGTAQLVNGGAGALAPGGLRQMAALTMSANGAMGGRILFGDSSTGAGGGLEVTGALTLHAAGAPVAGFTGVNFAGLGNVVQVGGDADVLSEGPLHFAFTDGGGLAVAGAFTGYSGTEIVIGHAGRPAGLYSLSADNIHLQTPGAISLTDGSALRAAGLLTLLAQGGNISLSGGSAADAGGDLRLFAQGSLLGAGSSLSAGGTAAIGLGGAGDILLGNLVSAGLLDGADASGNALGGSGIAIGGTFRVSGQLAVGPGSGTLSAASIGIGTLAGGTQTLTAPGGVQIDNALMSGDLIVNGNLTLGAGDIAGLLYQRAAGSTGFARLTGSVQAGAFDIDAGSITANALRARTGDLLLRSIADLGISDAAAAGAILLTSSAGGIGIGNAVAGGILTLTGTGIGAQRLGSGDAALLDAGAGDLTVGDIATGPVTAIGRNISLSATGGLTIASVSAGGFVSLTSADIVIGAAAGVTATGTLRFNATSGQQPAVIGGADVTGGYSLSAVEMARVTAADIAIAGASDIILRDVTVGLGLMPAGGVLSIGAAGQLRVEGAVRMTGRSGQGGLSLSAGQRLALIADSGSIALSDGNGALGGVLTLSAPSIFAASQSAIADVGAAQSLAARALRLAQNDGLVSDEGMLRAGAIQIAVTDGLYIQNSGLSNRFSDRRGFTADSLSIVTQGQPQIAINGRLALASGLFATGLGTIPLVAIDGSYATGSTINGCFIANAAACTGAAGTENRDTFEGLLDPSVSVARIFPLTLIQLRDIVTQGYPPLIDEPVTGAGNEDLWESHCGGEGEPACDAQ